MDQHKGKDNSGLNSLIHSMILDHTLGDSTADSGTLKFESSDMNNNSIWSMHHDHYASPNPLQSLFGIQSLGTGLTPTPTNENMNLAAANSPSVSSAMQTPKTNLEAAGFRAIRSSQHSGRKSGNTVAYGQQQQPPLVPPGAAAATGFNQDLIRAYWLEEMRRQQQETQLQLYSAELLKLFNTGSQYPYQWPGNNPAAAAAAAAAAASVIGSSAQLPGAPGAGGPPSAAAAAAAAAANQSLRAVTSSEQQMEGAAGSSLALAAAAAASGARGGGAGQPNYHEEVSSMAALYRNLMTNSDDEIEKAASFYRNSASTSDAHHHWSGKLPVRVYKNAIFSRKVFLGGVPWDVSDLDLQQAFLRFGTLQVLWPAREASNVQIRSSPRGYCYLIFDQELSVRNLLKQCTRDATNIGEYYFKISSSKMKAKEVQFTKQGSHRLDAKRTVFIGALHGMITAEALATIMNDLFGNVAFAALDTDKYKYPIGSGRVAFTSQRSYMKAVQANFVEVRTAKFTKTIQIDPYLEDSMCNHCFVSPGIYFCRAFECFRYFCPSCWNLWHGNGSDQVYSHKPLRRTFKTNLPDKK
uniref:RRM domain-containing protein n=1 Tax=Macrostomum lignano TaxID=282301 RepID=A0A1I8IV44_9PLAT